MGATVSENPRVRIGANNPPTREEMLKAKYADLFKRATAWVAKAKKANLSPKTPEECAVLDKLFADGRDIMNDANTVREKEKDEYLRAGKEVDATFNQGIRDILKPLADAAKQAAADRRLEITRQEQAKAAEAAEKARAEAEKIAERARVHEEKGDVRIADTVMAQAGAVQDAADRHAAFATQDVKEASRTVGIGGLKASVGVKHVCTAIIRPELDLETLRPFLKEAALIAAVDAYLKMGNRTLKGAVIQERAIGSVRR